MGSILPWQDGASPSRSDSNHSVRKYCSRCRRWANPGCHLAQKHLGLTISSDRCLSSHIETFFRRQKVKEARFSTGQENHQQTLKHNSTFPIFDQQWTMLVKSGTDRLLLTKHCRYVAGARTSWRCLMPTTSWLNDTEASEPGASRMACTPLAESSRKHNLLSVEDSATELVRKVSSSHFIIQNGTLSPQVWTTIVSHVA